MGADMNENRSIVTLAKVLASLQNEYTTKKSRYQQKVLDACFAETCNGASGSKRR